MTMEGIKLYLDSNFIKFSVEFPFIIIWKNSSPYPCKILYSPIGYTYTWLYLLIIENYKLYAELIENNGAAKQLLIIPARFPVLAASRVDTWNKRRASSTSTSVAKGAILILAKDSEILIIASNCLKYEYNIERRLKLYYQQRWAFSENK